MTSLTMDGRNRNNSGNLCGRNEVVMTLNQYWPGVTAYLTFVPISDCFVSILNCYKTVQKWQPGSKFAAQFKNGNLVRKLQPSWTVSLYCSTGSNTFTFHCQWSQIPLCDALLRDQPLNDTRIFYPLSIVSLLIMLEFISALQDFNGSDNWNC